MNGYTDLSNIENSRNCLRRIMHDDQEFSNQSIINVIEKFVRSVNSMEETILVPSRLMDRQVGDSTDSVQPSSAKSSHHNHHNKKKQPSTVRDHLVNTELFNLYSMLNSVKTDLLWGRNGLEEQPETTDGDLREQNYDTVETVPSMTETKVQVEEQRTVSSVPSAPQQQTNVTASTTAVVASQETKGHVRRPSTVSVSSSNSSTSTISDSESEVSSNENDSGIESEGQKDKDKSLEMSKQFRSHLIGLYQSLEQMTEAANYLTARYQSDIGTGSC